MNDELIRRNLKYIRRLRGYTQEKLGEALNVSGSTIGNYERGTRSIPAGLIHKIALESNVPDAFLINKIPKNITDIDIRENGVEELNKKSVNINEWKSQYQGKYEQIIQLLHTLLREMYDDLYLFDTNDKQIEEERMKIFDYFSDMDYDWSQNLKDFDDNFNLIYDTALFFFNYYVEQKRIYKNSNILHDSHFIERWKELLVSDSYSTDLLEYIKLDEEDS